MKIGLASPNSDYGVAPAAMAVDLEQRGYDSLWVGEHSHIPASRETPHPSGIELPKLYWHIRDPFVSLAVAAAATTTLKVVTGVCLVLEHEIIDLTKTVATLDEVSNGRLQLGVGVGWNREELAERVAHPVVAALQRHPRDHRRHAGDVGQRRSRLRRGARAGGTVVGVPQTDPPLRPARAAGLPGPGSGCAMPLSTPMSGARSTSGFAT